MLGQIYHYIKTRKLKQLKIVFFGLLLLFIYLSYFIVYYNPFQDSSSDLPNRTNSIRPFDTNIDPDLMGYVTTLNIELQIPAPDLPNQQNSTQPFEANVDSDLLRYVTTPNLELQIPAPLTPMPAVTKPTPIFPISYPQINRSNDSIAILLLSCSQATISKTLDLLVKYRPSKLRFPIIVSQDCIFTPIIRIIRSYKDEVYEVFHPNQTNIHLPPEKLDLKKFYIRARHYKWALNLTFNYYNFNSVVLLHDSFIISPDFYEYFAATLPVLQADPSLWCVSAWNDYGKVDNIDPNAIDLLYRTDYFSGMGWMLTKNIWQELVPKWPEMFTYDWMRSPKQSQNRSCIRPELSRIKPFYTKGIELKYVYDNYLLFIYLNDKFFNFTEQNLSYLIKETYDPKYKTIVYNSTIVTNGELFHKQTDLHHIESILITYDTPQILQRMLELVGLRSDPTTDVVPTAYQGVITFLYENVRIYLAPVSGGAENVNISKRSPAMENTESVQKYVSNELKDFNFKGTEIELQGKEEKAINSDYKFNDLKDFIKKLVAAEQPGEMKWIGFSLNPEKNQDTNMPEIEQPQEKVEPASSISDVPAESEHRGTAVPIITLFKKNENLTFSPSYNSGEQIDSILITDQEFKQVLESERKEFHSTIVTNLSKNLDDKSSEIQQNLETKKQILSSSSISNELKDQINQESVIKIPQIHRNIPSSGIVSNKPSNLNIEEAELQQLEIQKDVPNVDCMGNGEKILSTNEQEIEASGKEEGKSSLFRQLFI